VSSFLDKKDKRKNSHLNEIIVLFFRRNVQNGVSSTRPIQNGQNGPASVESPLAIEMEKLNSVVPPAVSTTCLIPRREQNEPVVCVTKNCEDTKRWV
jgi:hypothetical protein